MFPGDYREDPYCLREVWAIPIVAVIMKTNQTRVMVNHSFGNMNDKITCAAAEAPRVIFVPRDACFNISLFLGHIGMFRSRYSPSDRIV